MAALLQPSVFTLRRDRFLSRQERTRPRLSPRGPDCLRSDTQQVNFIHTGGPQGGFPGPRTAYSAKPLTPSQGLGGETQKAKSR